MQGANSTALVSALIIQTLAVGEWLNVTALDTTPLEYPTFIWNIWNMYALNFVA